MKAKELIEFLSKYPGHEVLVDACEDGFCPAEWPKIKTVFRAPGDPLRDGIYAEEFPGRVEGSKAFEAIVISR